MIKNFVKILELPGDRLEVFVSVCVSSDNLQVGERIKLYKEKNYAIKSNEYLD